MYEKPRGQHAGSLSVAELRGLHQHPHASATVGIAAMGATAHIERSIGRDAADLGTCDPYGRFAKQSIRPMPSRKSSLCLLCYFKIEILHTILYL